MARCLFRLTHPQASFSEYPHGLLNQVVPPSQSWPDGHAAEFASLLVDFAAGHVAPLLARLAEMPLGTTLSEQEFWTEQRDVVERFARKRRVSSNSAQPVVKSVLPLFPAL